MVSAFVSMFFVFNETATTEIYTLSLHDALPIFGITPPRRGPARRDVSRFGEARQPFRSREILDLAEEGTHLVAVRLGLRSEEHTSELQSHSDLVCRLLLEKKKPKTTHAAPRHAS